MKEIVGASLSRFHDSEDQFEFLIAYADGREVGHEVSRRAALTIQAELNRNLDLSTPPSTHVEVETVRALETANAPKHMIEAACKAINDRGKGNNVTIADIAFMIDAALSSTPAQHVACPCTLIEQDEDCSVGYPSLLCGVCDGKGHTTQEQLRALACEMIKIASDIGGPEDPFAAWESIDLIKSQHERMRKALAPFAEVADRFDGVPVSAILPQQCWFTPHSLREARAALATTEGKDNG